MKKGMDISNYQGIVDFGLVKKSNIEFIIFREGWGRYSIDPKFFDYVKQAKAAGYTLLWVYHFSYALNEEQAREEARSCVDNLRIAGLGDDTLVFYDFEYDTVKYAASKGVTLSKADCNAHTLAFCEEVKRLGYTPGVYTNLDYYKNWYNKDVLSRYYIWLADYTGGPDFDCLVQQYTSTGSVLGIKGNVDLDYLFEEKLKIGDETSNSASESKDVNTLAKEVILGIWGNGVARKEALVKAGYNYDEVQRKVNEILNEDADKAASSVVPSTPITGQVKKVETTCYATSKDSSLAGTYTTTADLYCRNNAGTNNKALCLIPKGTKVKNYGFYTEFNGVKWLLIQFVLNGIQYTGFSSSLYLA